MESSWDLISKVRLDMAELRSQLDAFSKGLSSRMSPRKRRENLLEQGLSTFDTDMQPLTERREETFPPLHDPRGSLPEGAAINRFSVAEPDKPSPAATTSSPSPPSARAHDDPPVGNDTRSETGTLNNHLEEHEKPMWKVNMPTTPVQKPRGEPNDPAIGKPTPVSPPKPALSISTPPRSGVHLATSEVTGVPPLSLGSDSARSEPRKPSPHRESSSSSNADLSPPSNERLAATGSIDQSPPAHFQSPGSSSEHSSIAVQLAGGDRERFPAPTSNHHASPPASALQSTTVATPRTNTSAVEHENLVAAQRQNGDSHSSYVNTTWKQADITETVDQRLPSRGMTTRALESSSLKPKNAAGTQHGASADTPNPHGDSSAPSPSAAAAELQRLQPMHQYLDRVFSPLSKPTTGQRGAVLHKAATGRTQPSGASGASAVKQRPPASLNASTDTKGSIPMDPNSLASPTGRTMVADGESFRPRPISAPRSHSEDWQEEAHSRLQHKPLGAEVTNREPRGNAPVPPFSAERLRGAEFANLLKSSVTEVYYYSPMQPPRTRAEVKAYTRADATRLEQEILEHHAQQLPSKRLVQEGHARGRSMFDVRQRIGWSDIEGIVEKYMQPTSSSSSSSFSLKPLPPPPPPQSVTSQRSRSQSRSPTRSASSDRDSAVRDYLYRSRSHYHLPASIASPKTARVGPHSTGRKQVLGLPARKARARALRRMNSRSVSPSPRFSPATTTRKRRSPSPGPRPWYP